MNASVNTKTLKNFKGDVLQPNENGYEEARKIWNGMIDKKPAYILRCSNKEDIAAGISFAKENNLPLSIKGGGHGIAGFAVADQGVMLDLSLMKKVSVDGKTIQVQAGALLSDLDTATNEKGMAVPSGIISHTGVSGITLGGGFGWISRKFGFSIDNLLSAEVITANGDVLTASSKENTDLFWALRGGGGNFGVVSSFTFQCSEIGKEVFSGFIVQPFEIARDFLQFHRDFLHNLPDEMTIWTVIRNAPPLPFIPEEKHGKLVIILPFVYLGSQADGENLLKPLLDKFKPLGFFSGMNNWAAWQSGFDPLAVHGFRNYWKSHNIKDMSDKFIDTITEFALSFPSPHCEIFIPHFEGFPSRIPDNETAYAFRKVPFAFNIHTRWESPEDDEKCLQWAREFHEATKPFSEGVYVNFLSDEGKDRVKDAYRPETWQRLVEIKKKYDPENIFRSNQNISTT